MKYLWQLDLLFVLDADEAVQPYGLKEIVVVVVDVVYCLMPDGLRI